jgi:major membrane immunogen (membrane-anchored lipoprotein)
MKKVLLGFILLMALFVVGCEKVDEGKYVEGTYLGVKDTVDRNGEKFVTTALVNVDDKGMITNVFIDVTYTTSEGVNTTKKVLGDAYGMKATSANIGVIEGGAEWYEQVEVIENKVVSEQGIEWFTFKEDAPTKTDAVSGVTITVTDYHAALVNALEQAKK